MPKPPRTWIVTGNFTSEGAVAYLQSDQTFTRNIADVQVFERKEDAEAARALVSKSEALVTDAYVLDVDGSGPELDVLTARERIRAHGPTVPYGRISKADKSSVA